MCSGIGTMGAMGAGTPVKFPQFKIRVCPNVAICILYTPSTTCRLNKMQNEFQREAEAQWEDAEIDTSFSKQT